MMKFLCFIVAVFSLCLYYKIFGKILFVFHIFHLNFKKFMYVQSLNSLLSFYSSYYNTLSISNHGFNILLNLKQYFIK